MVDHTDYKELYFKLFRAANRAVELPITVQQACEELYCSTADSELKILDFAKTDHSKP